MKTLSAAERMQVNTLKDGDIHMHEDGRCQEWLIVCCWWWWLENPTKKL